MFGKTGLAFSSLVVFGGPYKEGILTLIFSKGLTLGGVGKIPFRRVWGPRIDILAMIVLAIHFDIMGFEPLSKEDLSNPMSQWRSITWW